MNERPRILLHPRGREIMHMMEADLPLPHDDRLQAGTFRSVTKDEWNLDHPNRVDKGSLRRKTSFACDPAARWTVCTRPRRSIHSTKPSTRRGPTCRGIVHAHSVAWSPSGISDRRAGHAAVPPDAGGLWRGGTGPAMPCPAAKPWPQHCRHVRTKASIASCWRITACGRRESLQNAFSAVRDARVHGQDDNQSRRAGEVRDLSGDQLALAQARDAPLSEFTPGPPEAAW